MHQFMDQYPDEQAYRAFSHEFASQYAIDTPADNLMELGSTWEAHMTNWDMSQWDPTYSAFATGLNRPGQDNNQFRRGNP